VSLHQSELVSFSIMKHLDDFVRGRLEKCTKPRVLPDKKLIPRNHNIRRDD